MESKSEQEMKCRNAHVFFNILHIFIFINIILVVVLSIILF